jgi:hypothetical protein
MLVLHEHAYISTIFTSVLGQLVVRMSRKPACWVGLGCLSIGVATIPNKKTLFVTLVDLIPRYEAYCGQFFLPTSIDSLCLRVAQMPESREVVIFWITTTTPWPSTLPPCACTWGNYQNNYNFFIHNCDWWCKYNTLTHTHAQPLFRLSQFIFPFVYLLLVCHCVDFHKGLTVKWPLREYQYIRLDRS